MIPDVWISSGGSYAAANEQFINAQVVMYVGQLANRSVQREDRRRLRLVAVPNPCGPGGCTGVPGGAALVAIADTEHPKRWRVMEYLSSEEIWQSSRRTLFIPGHLGLAETGVDFDTDVPSQGCPGRLRRPGSAA